MKRDPVTLAPARGTASFATDLALIAEAIVDAFRALSPAQPESRWSKLRYCGCSF